MFLLGRQATLGHEPPSDLRSTITVRRPASAIVQAINLPAPPLPITRFSYFSMLDMGTPLLSVAKCMSVEVRYELAPGFLTKTLPVSCEIGSGCGVVTYAETNTPTTSAST